MNDTIGNISNLPNQMDFDRDLEMDVDVEVCVHEITFS